MEETLTIDGINVCYDVEGNGEPLLLVHGLGIGKSIWKQFVADAVGLFTVYSVDLPGFGCSDAPDLPYGIPFYVDFLRKFMSAVGVEDADVAGISMGASIAAMFAARYPERVSRLALIAPVGLTPLHSRFASASWLVDTNFWLLSKNQGIYRKSLEESFYDPSKLPEWLVEEAWANMKKPSYRRAFLRNAQLLSRQEPEFKDALSLIQASTLILWGSADRVVPASDSDRYGRLITGSEVRVLEKCGHTVLVECPEQANDLILSFLGEEDLYYSNEETAPTKK